MKQVNCAACRQRITLRYGEGSCIFRASWCNFGINEAQLSQTNWGVREFYRQKRVSWTNGVNIQGVRNRWQKSRFSGKIPTYRVYRITDRCIYMSRNNADRNSRVRENTDKHIGCSKSPLTKIQVSTKNTDRNTRVWEKYRLKYTCPGTIPTEIHVSGDPTDKNIGYLSQ